MRFYVIGCVQLAPRVANYDLLTIVYLKTPNEKANSFVYTRLDFESLCIRIPKHLNARAILLAQ